jgi:hypothetical protein
MSIRQFYRSKLTPITKADKPYDRKAKKRLGRKSIFLMSYETNEIMNDTDTLFCQFKELYSSCKLNDQTEGFVRDGIINPSIYSLQRTKILFIAKEHNQLSQPTDCSNERIDRDYRMWWNVDFKYRFAHRVSEWACGILDGFLTDYEQINYEQKSSAIRSIAFINVKKTCGGSRATHSVILDYIKYSRELLHQQIEAISPTLIVGCFRYDHFVEELFNSQLALNRVVVSDGFNFSYGRWKHINIINFYHPSSRLKKKRLYELMREALERVIKS